MNEPFLSVETVDQVIAELRIPDPGQATIREIVALVNGVEARSGVKYVRMEMGVPGLKPAQVGIDAEVEALRRGVASIYPMVDGVPELKQEAARFIRSFMDVEIEPAACIPAVGSMQATYAAFMAAGYTDKRKDTALFIDPGLDRKSVV